MEEILEILGEVKPGVDFENATDLVGSGVLDSMTIIQLVARLSDEYHIEITPLDLVPENFESAAAIKALVERLED